MARNFVVTVVVKKWAYWKNIIVQSKKSSIDIHTHETMFA